jgi:hypothetical protein
MTDTTAAYRLAVAADAVDGMSDQAVRLALWNIVLDGLAGRMPEDLFSVLGRSMGTSEQVYGDEQTYSHR